jgi:hypothetical protein
VQRGAVCLTARQWHQGRRDGRVVAGVLAGEAEDQAQARAAVACLVAPLPVRYAVYARCASDREGRAYTHRCIVYGFTGEGDDVTEARVPLEQRQFRGVLLSGGGELRRGEVVRVAREM